MTWEDWFGYFKRTTADPELRDALRKAGYPEVPPVPREESDSRVEEGGLLLVFLDVALYPSLASGLGAGYGVLGEMTFVVDEKGRAPWRGDLPFGLTPQSTQEDVRARLGQPEETNDTFNWDLWQVDGYTLIVEFTEDRSRLSLVTVEALPRSGED
jgi:hypothetical protein